MKNVMFRKALRVTVMTTVAATFLAGSALAVPAVPSSQTGTAFPGRVPEQFKKGIETPQQTLPNIEVKQLSIQGAPEGAEKIELTLSSVDLSGVTVYGMNELSALYQDKIGQKITLADVYAIAADLTRKYRNDGYILTQVVVPPQTIEKGDVKLQVVEGYIDSIDIKGASGESKMSLQLMREYASTVKTKGGKALNASDLERAMLLINDLPGVTARGVLSPSAGKVGAADLTIIEDRKVADGLVGIDNYGSRFLGPVQLTGAAGLNSVLGLNERFTAQVVVDPELHSPPEMYYGSLDYEMPISGTGTFLELYANEAVTDPGYTLRPFDVRGRSYDAGLRVKHNFIRTRALNLTSRLTFDYNDVNSWNNVDPFIRRDRIRSLRFGSKLDFLDQIFGGGYNVVDAEVSHGLSIMGVRGLGDPDVSRPAAGPDYAKYTAEIQRLQRLFSKLNLLLAGKGQLSNDALYSSEEFGIGGATGYGRGYDPSEITGDSGLAGKAELQWNSPLESSWIDKYQLFAFYDIGRTWNNDPTTAAEQRASLASTGFGTRVDFTPSTTGGLMVGFPLTKLPQTQKDRSARFFMGLYQRF